MCIYINSESLPNNYECLELLIENTKPIMVFCSETCVTEQISDTELHINGYNLARCDSHSRHTGGVVAIYVRENIIFEIINNVAIDRNVWFITIKVKCTGIKGTYSVLYHSPSSSHANFLNYFEELLAENGNSDMTNVIIGDFNIDLERSQYGGRLLRVLRLCESFALKQKVNFITRRTNNTETKIDLIFSNDDELLCYPLPEEKISDHETIAMHITNKNRKLGSVKKQYVAGKIIPKRR